MRKSLISVLVMAFALINLGPAAAQTPAEVAETVAVQGYYVEAGSEAVSEAELAELADTMQDRGYNFVAVVLAEDPSGGANAFAAAVVEQFSEDSTVVVLSPGELGFASTEFSAAELTAAGEDSIDLFSTDVNDGFALFADNLVTGAGSGFPWALVLILGALVLLVFWVVRRQAQVEKQRSVEDISEARVDKSGSRR